MSFRRGPKMLRNWQQNFTHLKRIKYHS